MTTIKELIEKYNIKINCKYGIKTPYDKLDNWQKDSHKYTCVLSIGRKRMTVDFFLGTSYTTDPTSDMVLSGLIEDYTSVLNYDFEEFCDNLGYNSDSRKAEKIYKKCERLKNKLNKFLGEEILREFAETNGL